MRASSPLTDAPCLVEPSILEHSASVKDHDMRPPSSGLFPITNQLVQARVDEEIKDGATVVLATMDLTVSNAVRLLLTRVAREKELPFALIVPSAETIVAMKQARAGNIHEFVDAQSPLDDLNADN